MSATIWMVLNPDQDRILLKTPSRLEAFRVACRRAGGSARLERDIGFGVTVTGRKRSLTVFPVPTNDRSAPPHVLPAAPDVLRGVPFAELVDLPEGGTFVWVPPA